MAGDPVRGFVPLATIDSWLRCAYTDAALDLESVEVTLAWDPTDETTIGDEETVPPGPAGLAFDGSGCLYHGDPERSQVQRVAGRNGGGDDEPVDLLVPLTAPSPGTMLVSAAPSPVPGTTGSFQAVGSDPLHDLRPVALATDDAGYLSLLDGPTGAIHVIDLVDGRLVRTIVLPWRVLDLAGEGDRLLVVTDDPRHRVLEVGRSGQHTSVEIPAAALTGVPPASIATRVATGPGGERWIAVTDGARWWAVPVADARRAAPLELQAVTDIELDGSGALVVAHRPRGSLRRWVFTQLGDAEDAPLRARGYDGRGIVRTPDGGIGFWSNGGFRLALEGRRRFRPSGHVDCFRFDGQAYRQQWGRVFVDACVPAGTRLRIGFATSDDEPDLLEPEGPSILRTAPANLVIDAEELPPVEPPLVAEGRVATVATPWDVHRRGTGCELPWVTREPGDRFETYEVPVHAPPGRYLWLRLMLEGTTRTTPRIRAVRAEYPGHDLLRRLPKAYSRDEVAASFLQRYLGIAAGLLSDVEARAAHRDLLLDPWGAPAEVLPWLASLVGLTLDTRWPEAARRTMLAEAICLFRRRGTLPGLKRMLEIYLDCPVVLVEAFRLRGPGGAFATDDATSSVATRSVVGAGLRVGGEVGEETTEPLTGTVSDAFSTHAHRFSVIIPRDLDEEQRAAVDHLLELHRPAHTLVEVCTAGRGMRVGLGLHVELSALVGPGSGFDRAVVGETRVGPGAVLGRPRAGIRPGGAHVGRDTVVDP